MFIALSRLGGLITREELDFVMMNLGDDYVSISGDVSSVLSLRGWAYALVGAEFLKDV